MGQARGIVLVLLDCYDHKSNSSFWMNIWFGIISARIMLQAIVLWMRGNVVIFYEMKPLFVIKHFD